MTRPVVGLLVALSACFGNRVAADGLVTVQANDPSIEYSDAAQWAHSEACGGTQYSFGLGQWFSFEFNGTSISLVGTVDLYGGILTITLDGEQSTFNRYSPLAGSDSYNPQCSTTLFQQTSLTTTLHTLTVNHTGDSTSGAIDDNHFFEWQYLQYYETEDQGQTTSKSHVAAIAGGVAGGVGLALVLALMLLLFRRKRDERPVFPVDLVGDMDSFSMPTNAVVEPFVPPPQRQADPTGRQIRMPQSRSSSSSSKQMSNAANNAATMPYLADQNRHSSTLTPNRGTRGGPHDEEEFNPYTLGPQAPNISMTDPRRTGDRPLSIDFSVAGSNSQYQPSSSRIPSSLEPMLPEKGPISMANPDPSGPLLSSAARLPERIVSQLPALSDADMARLAAQVANMLQSGSPPSEERTLAQQSLSNPDGVDDAPPQYSRVAR